MAALKKLTSQLEVTAQKDSLVLYVNICQYWCFK